MNLNLPSSSGGLGRGRVWRSQAWVVGGGGGGQPIKPWVGTLSSELWESGGGGRRMSAGGGGPCPWADGRNLPLIQQRQMTLVDSLVDYRLPSPTTPTASCVDWTQQQQPSGALTSSSPVDVIAGSFEVVHNQYVSRAYTPT